MDSTPPTNSTWPSYEVPIFNINEFTHKACADITVDESTWGFRGFGIPGTGLISRILNKPVNKGGQVVIWADAEAKRYRPRGFVMRHKLHDKPKGFGSTGPNEIRMLVDKIKPMIIGQEKVDGVKQIYHGPPHITADNFFSGDTAMDYIGSAVKGMGASMTNRRDRQPSGVPKKYFHTGKTRVEERSKAARFVPPIVAVKMFPPKDGKPGYRRIHVSMQSTSSTNFCTVNALGSCNNNLRTKGRGKGNYKRQWFIEDNEGRSIYLGSYGYVDRIDQMIRKSAIKCRSNKYWFPAKLHGDAMGLTASYGIYLECAEGGLREEWKVEKPVSPWEFQRRCSIQMIQYDPKENRYPGDKSFRQWTKLTQAQRQQNKRPKKRKASTEELQHEMALGRLCIDFDEIEDHVRSIKSHRGGDRKCAVCNVRTYTVCTLCGAPLHVTKHRVPSVCFLRYHSPHWFGITKRDSKRFMRKPQQWHMPTPNEIVFNRIHIASLQQPAILTDNESTTTTTTTDTNNEYI